MRVTNAFTRALASQPQARPPIWCMRQAGRYQRAYQTFRRRHSFEKLCRDPELSAKVALASIEDFDFDAAILFSDLLFPLDAMGLGLTLQRRRPAAGPPVLEIDRRPAARSTRSRPISRSRQRRSRRPGANFRLTRVSSGSSADPGRSSCTPSRGRIGARWRAPSRRSRCTAGSRGRWCPSSSAWPRGNSPPAPTLSWSSTRRPANWHRMPSGGTSSPTSRKSPRRRRAGWATSHEERIRLTSRTASRCRARGRDRVSIGAGRSPTSCPGQAARGLSKATSTLRFFTSKADSSRRAIDEFLTPLASLEPDARRGWICGLGHGVLPGRPRRACARSSRTSAGGCVDARGSVRQIRRAGAAVHELPDRSAVASHADARTSGRVAGERRSKAGRVDRRLRAHAVLRVALHVLWLQHGDHARPRP